MSNSKRIDYLDNSKGILIILMVAAHVFQDCYFYDFTYSFHMMAFFFISGILLNYSSSLTKPYKKVIESKIRTMAIPFVFFELLGILRDLLRGYHQSIFGFLHNTISLQFNNGILWFLFTIFFAELIFVPFAKAIRNHYYLALIAIVLLVFSYFVPQSSEVLVYAVRISRAIFFLCSGYLSERLFSKQRSFIAFVCIAAVAVLTALHLNVEFTTPGLRSLPFYIINSFCGIFFILNVSMYRFWGKWLKVIGSNSLIVYGTHSLYYVVFGYWLGITDFTAITLWQGLIVLLLVALAEIPTVYLLNRYAPFLVGKRHPKMKAVTS